MVEITMLKLQYSQLSRESSNSTGIPRTAVIYAISYFILDVSMGFSSWSHRRFEDGKPGNKISTKFRLNFSKFRLGRENIILTEHYIKI